MDEITQKINNQIAEYFIADSKEFLFRYKKLKDFQTHISNRSKLLIDLIFSIECSLKALIFFESTNNEKVTFRKIKTHNLKYLFDQISNRSEIMQLIQLFDEEIDIYEISSRYTLDANINFRENNFLGTKYYSTIADFRWLDNVCSAASSFLEHVEFKIGTEISIINLSNIDEEIEIGNRIKNIHCAFTNER